MLEKGSPVFLIVSEVTNRDGLLTIYGRLENGQSVIAKTSTFKHYFYVESVEDIPLPFLNDNIHEAARQKLDDQQYIIDIERVDRIPLMGYRPTGAVPMLKITASFPKYVNPCQKILEQRGLLTHEGSTSFVLRYMVDKGFGGFDWLQINQWHETSPFEIEYDHVHLFKVPNKSDVGPSRWLAFDIEACKSGNGRGFVNASEDPVSQIGNTLYTSNHTILERRVFCLVPEGKGVTPRSEYVLETFTDEGQMLLAWARYIVSADPDVITGYNVLLFDFPYLFDRAKALGVDQEFALMGKVPDVKATVRKASFSSAGKGAREDFTVTIEGRFVFDMLKFEKDTLMPKARSYSLGNIASIVLGNAKVEMDYKLIPEYQAGTDDQRAHLCYYCWWDAELCYELMKKQMAIVNYIETARVCGVPMKFLLDRGQQILTMSLLLRFCKTRNFVVPSSTESQNDEKTKGATVLEPKLNFYKEPIVTLDFQSLYPSIIRDSNICYSTKTSLSWAQKHLKPGDFFVPPIAGISYCYVAHHIHRGILSEMEETLFAKRSEAKDDLKREKDPEKKNVLNGRQNAIKLRMNSIYGFLKANMVCDKDLMESVTGVGRFMIEASKNLVESHFAGSEVVYGDSVTGDTPCLLQDADGLVRVLTIDSIGHGWTTGLDGKEYSTAPPFKVWTERGWTDIKRVIRHKLGPDKKLVRVSTRTGIVDCTTDHGLVTADGVRVSPNDVKSGDYLMHSFFESWRECKPRNDLERFGKSSLLIPFEIFNLSLEEREAYWEGYNRWPKSKVYIKGKAEALSVFTLLRSLGHYVYVSFAEDFYCLKYGKKNIPGTSIKKIEPIPSDPDQYVYDLETENHHFHAGVGQLIVHNTDSIFINFGPVSVEEAFHRGQIAAEMCTKLFTDGKPRAVHLLQREKLFLPFLLIGKKKYTGNKCLGPGLPFKRDETGLENVRRDNALIGSETLDMAADMVIVQEDYTGEKTIRYVQGVISDLLMGRIEPSKLIISKNLSKSFKHYEESGTMQPHVELSKKIAARSHQTGEQTYATGDRVPFVMIAGLKGTKNSMCAEDPLYALKHRLPIDFSYYIENQMMKPLIRLLMPIIAPHERMKKRNKKGDKVYISDKEMRELKTYKALFVGPHMMSKVVKTGEVGIMRFTKKIESCQRCGCSIAPSVKRSLGGDEQRVSRMTLCVSCEPKAALVHMELRSRMNQLEHKRWACWTACQQCVGERYHEAVVCANRDCSNFYTREKVVMDIEDLANKI